MDQHQPVLFHGGIVPECIQAVTNGVLPRIAAGHHPFYLLDEKLLKQLPHIGKPRLHAHHHDGVNERVFLKFIKGMNNDGLSVQLQKLLGLRFGVHSLACSAGENHCIVHVLFPPMISFIFATIRSAA